MAASLASSAAEVGTVDVTRAYPVNIQAFETWYQREVLR